MSSLPEVRSADEFANILTGELIPRTDTAALARYLVDLRDFRGQLAELVKLVEAEVVAAARDRGTKTLHLDGVEARVTGGTRLDWDVTVLEELHEAGLPEDRWAELVTTEISYKVNTLVAKSIEASGNARYADIIRRARRVAETPQRVSVKLP